MAMVKCTICGAIFEDTLDLCPVCKQGPAFWVPVEEVAPETHDTAERFVILGGGPAGISAAEAIRARNATASITLLSDEDMLPYNRPMLTKSFDADDAALPVHAADWYKARRIDTRTGHCVSALDAQARQITLTNGDTIPYDKCIYALGAYSFVPDMPGVGLPEARVIRGVADIRGIRSLLADPGKRVVVIGGGVLGLEAAWALKCLACDVTVVEMAPRIMARQLDADASAWLVATAEKAGIRVLQGAATQAIEGDEHVTGVRLADGTVLPADVVILSIGVRAHTAIAKAAGAEIDRGVLVDDHMRTSLPDVYAAGDCAQAPGPGAQLWPVAAEMGRVAGINAAGGDEAYVPVSFAVTFHGMDTILYAEGDVGFDAAKAYRIEVDEDAAAHTMVRRYYVDDALCGVILLGDIGEAVRYAAMLAGKKG